MIDRRTTSPRAGPGGASWRWVRSFGASRPLLAGWLLGLVTAILVAAIIGGLFLSGIAFDTSASKPHSRIVAWALHATMVHSVRHRAGGQEDPGAARRASAASGAVAYQTHCVACHGGPATARAPWANAMLPPPPYLIDASRRWSRAELYRLVHDGVKMTAMPAWGEALPDQAISDIVAFLELLPRLTPDQFACLGHGARASPGAGGIAPPRPADAGAPAPGCPPRR